MSIKKASSSAIVGTSKPRLWHQLGAGLITGAADDDPSGIATYSQAGTQFGFSLGWTLLLTYPLMVAIQRICAVIGRATGHGIAGNLRAHYPSWLLHAIVALLFVANTFNIGADLGAMAQATRLLVPAVPSWLLLIAFSALCTLGQVLLHHTRCVAMLKWLTLSLLSYFAVLFAVHVAWIDLLKGLLWPHLTMSLDFWLMVAAVLGTTISPYLFFWQAAQEVEDMKAEPAREPLLRRPEQGPAALSRIRVDTLTGMGMSNLVALAILTTAASTLEQQGISEIGSAAQAAEALRPLAGDLAFLLFTLGIVGTGLLSVPVLAGSAAYALGESCRWPVGLSRRPSHAKGFYAAIAVATLIGAAANVLAINPVKALVWSAVLNAIVAVPIMAVLMRIASNPTIMGQFRITARWRYVGWSATAIMAAASLAFLLSLFVSLQG